MEKITDNSYYETADEGTCFERLCKVLKVLRSPEGCPWDIKQTPMTLRNSLIEETYEAVDAINNGDAMHVCEELGDILLNAVMIANIYEEKSQFDVKKILNSVCEKIIRRHPHVWKPEGYENNISSASDVLNQWEKIKENVEGRKKKCELEEVCYGLPPLLRAYKIQKKAAKKGFDWENIEDVWKKVDEEMSELRQSCKDESNIEEEVGDVLFSVVNLARKLGVDPEIALAKTNAKFIKRYSYVEQKMEETSQAMEQKNLPIMDSFWEEAKKIFKGN